MVATYTFGSVYFIEITHIYVINSKHLEDVFFTTPNI